MQKILYSPYFLGSTIPTDMNSEGSDIIINNIQTPSTTNNMNTCSISNAIWYGPVQNLSTDSTCSCPNLIKVSRKLSGITYYKCEINQ